MAFNKEREMSELAVFICCMSIIGGGSLILIVAFIMAERIGAKEKARSLEHETIGYREKPIG